MPVYRLPPNCSLASYKKESVPADREEAFQGQMTGLPQEFTIDPDSLEVTAHDSCGARAAVHKGIKRCEAHRAYTGEQWRQARKDIAKFSVAATIPCPHRSCEDNRSPPSPILQIHPHPHKDETMDIFAPDERTTELN